MFITLEGSEGAGKSTLIEHLKKYFLDRKIDFIFTKEPGATEEGAELRKLLLDKSLELDPLSETFLLLADRLEHVRKIINPALKENKNILSDRYLDSTYAYQEQRKLIKMIIRQTYKTIKIPSTRFDYLFRFTCRRRA